MSSKSDSITVQVTCHRHNGSAFTFTLRNITSSDGLWAGIDLVLAQRDETIKSFERMALQISRTPIEL